MPIKGKRPQNNTTRDRSRVYLYYADATGDIDIFADCPLEDSVLPNAEIHVLGAGDLVVERVDGTVVGPFPVPAGYVFPAEARKILEASTAADFLVFW